MTAVPLHEVFRARAQAVGRILRGRVWRMDGFSSHEKLIPTLYQNDDGSSRLYYHRSSDGHGCIEIDEVRATSVADLQYGEETIHESEQLGSNSEIIDNRRGVNDVDVSFHDVFSETDSEEHEEEKSAGGSITTTLESEQDIEGVASFKESVEAEVHTELSDRESSGSDTTREEGGEEGTTVPVGVRVRIKESRERASGEMDVTGHGTFTHTLQAGKHSGGHFVHHGNQKWGSWQDFVDVVHGAAPANYPLAESFENHPAAQDDLRAVLEPLEADVRYKATFQGRTIRNYVVEVLDDGTDEDVTPMQACTTCETHHGDDDRHTDDA